MDYQDKLFEQIKEAERNAENQDFPAMEKVWSRLEEKLDKKEAKKTIALWQKIAVAASLLLVLSIGFQFLNSSSPKSIQEAPAVVTTTTKNNPSAVETNENTTNTTPAIVTKAEAEEIIDNIIGQEVAVHNTQSKDTIMSSATNAISIPEIATAIASSEVADEKDTEFNKIEPRLAALAPIAKEKASYKMAFAEKSQERAKKSSPLVVIGNIALSNSNESKRERLLQNELSNFKPENLESVIVLDNPLYIIDGNYFSEDDLFGPQPKSPYAPLNHQDIKTIVILKDTDAVSEYGEKGKKGVVIITTKTGKPAVQK
ncbi:MAG: hypothetical protein ACOVKP_04190 [Flavobacterium sp.]